MLQAPAILVVDTLRRHSPIVERLQDHYARWRRETWRPRRTEVRSRREP
jgi:hypothetical protein